MSSVTSGLLVGLLLGSGLALIWLGLPWNRRHTLADRVLPYVLDQGPLTPDRLGAGTIARGGAVRTVLRRAGAAIDRVTGDGPTVARRLQRAGLPPDVDGFRVQQVICGVGCALIGVVLGALGLARGDLGPMTVVAIVLISGALGVVAWDHVLSRRAQRRERRMLAEFPTIAEFLALAVGAGEGAVGALDRVCRLSRGELADELRRCLADARAGASLPVALGGLADRTGLPVMVRFVDGLVVAVERGTPLADVLRAQAQDVREAGRRAVIETGGRREIAMMLPVVFLLLPLTVLFALFPAFAFFTFSL